MTATDAKNESEIVVAVNPEDSVNPENSTNPENSDLEQAEKIKILKNRLEILRVRADILEVKEKIAKSQRALGLPKKI